ncbi:hypothetical protein, partial [Nocardioides malaquae]|uniref:hypothetical protein n=1 Tax=Nocardioides malaquae TaxID=2773426 RepID=UPI001D0D00D6
SKREEEAISLLAVSHYWNRESPASPESRATYISPPSSVTHSKSKNKIKRRGDTFERTKACRQWGIVIWRKIALPDLGTHR